MGLTTHRRRMVRIGTAGWVIPRQSAEMAAGEGSHLERYARVIMCGDQFELPSGAPAGDVGAVGGGGAGGLPVFGEVSEDGDA